MPKTAKTTTADIGFKRLYQPWAKLPVFDSQWGEWLHSDHVPLGNPCKSTQECQSVVDDWLQRHKRKIERLNKKVATSKRVGSEDTRVIARVYQMWPRTDSTPGDSMFTHVIDDPFVVV